MHTSHVVTQKAHIEQIRTYGSCMATRDRIFFPFPHNRFTNIVEIFTRVC